MSDAPSPAKRTTSARAAQDSGSDDDVIDDDAALLVSSDEEPDKASTAKKKKKATVKRVRSSQPGACMAWHDVVHRSRGVKGIMFHGISHAIN